MSSGGDSEHKEGYGWVSAGNWRRLCCAEGWGTYGKTLQEQEEEKNSVVQKTTNWCPQWTLADAPNFKV